MIMKARTMMLLWYNVPVKNVHLFKQCRECKIWLHIKIINFFNHIHSFSWFSLFYFTMKQTNQPVLLFLKPILRFQNLAALSSRLQEAYQSESDQILQNNQKRRLCWIYSFPTVCESGQIRQNSGSFHDLFHFKLSGVLSDRLVGN